MKPLRYLTIYAHQGETTKMSCIFLRLRLVSKWRLHLLERIRSHGIGANFYLLEKTLMIWENDISTFDDLPWSCTVFITHAVRNGSYANEHISRLNYQLHLPVDKLNLHVKYLFLSRCRILTSYHAWLWSWNSFCICFDIIGGGLQA